jgi:hypothetical protein
MDDLKFIAYNIVNQLADFYSEKIPSQDWIEVRQASNDQLDTFVFDFLSKEREKLAEQYRKYRDNRVQSLERRLRHTTGEMEKWRGEAKAMELLLTDDDLKAKPLWKRISQQRRQIKALLKDKESVERVMTMLRTERDEVKRYERDNHHNARMCPYCTPNPADREQPMEIPTSAEMNNLESYEI